MELLGIFTFAIPQAPHKVEKGVKSPHYGSLPGGSGSYNESQKLEKRP